MIQPLLFLPGTSAEKAKEYVVSISFQNIH